MPGKCRVVLVRPPINRTSNAPFFLPLGLLCVTSPLRDSGHDVEIVDYEFLTRAGRFRLDDETWLADICGPLLERRPQLIGITVLADTLPVGLLIGRYLRRASLGFVVAMGGPGVFGAFPAPAARVQPRRGRLHMHERRRTGDDRVGRRLGRRRRPPADPRLLVAGQPWCARGRHREFAIIDLLPMPAYDAVPVPEYLEMAAPRIFDVYLG